MRADFVNEVARILDIKRKDLIEKDLILHQILFDLSRVCDGMSQKAIRAYLSRVIDKIGEIFKKS